MIDNKRDLFELLQEHKKSISHSFLFYRTKAKMQKMAVLEAAVRYLTGKISWKDLNIIVNKNTHYADAIGNSKTKELIDAVFKHKPSLRRTKEGYCRFY